MWAVQYLFAAINSVGLADLAPFLSSTGSIGFAVWFGYHNTTKTTPDLLKAHAREREMLLKLQDAAQVRHDKQIAQLLNELHASREEATAARLKFAEWMGREAG